MFVYAPGEHFDPVVDRPDRETRPYLQRFGGIPGLGYRPGKLGKLFDAGVFIPVNR